MADYSIWVLEYAAVELFPLSVMLYGPQYKGTRKLPYGYVLLKGRDRVVMIDTGYDHVNYGKALADAYGVSNYHGPREVLAECGIAPEDVTDILITHAHFDHMGAIHLFPNATFYVQKRELDKWAWALSLGSEYRFLTGGGDPADIVKAVEAAQSGRLKTIDGDQDDVLPGIDVRLAADTHTYGSMYVTVRNDGARASEDTYVFAGDLIYTWDNFTGLDPSDPQIVPIGLAVGSQSNLIFASAAMLKDAGGEHRRVIPVHEDRLRTQYPSRLTDARLQIVEIALGAGETSRVQ
ncbi:N-acyl homoserine lactonase family protein [Ensifer soli]|uniref:N-acyl homoserine lactonase family protein n=1 Tax=Ciceribacter sp. sgz301302 TaxID=3342379 RepID=UPI0035B86B4E